MTGSSSYIQSVCIAVGCHGVLVCSESYPASDKTAAA